MKKFTSFSLILVSLLFSQALLAQTNYRSAATGDWTSTPATTWEIETSPGVWGPAVAAPTSADGTITIRNGHNVTVGTAAANADQLLVETGGTLTVNNTLTLNDGAGVDLEVDGTLVLFNTLATGTGTPTVQMDGVMNWTGGTLGVPTTVTATGDLNISGANKTLSTTITNDGNIDWSASQISFNGGIVNNNATFNATGDNPINSGAGTNAFNNNATGVFTKSVGTGNTTISIPVTNAGTFNMNSGTVVSTSATGTFNNTGTLNFGGGALTLNGTLAGGNILDATTVLSGTGTLNINQLTAINFAMAPPSTLTLSIGGVALNTNLINGTGSLSISGTFNWSTGRLAIPTTIEATGTFNSTAGKDFAANFTNNGIANLTDGPPFNNGSWDLENITFTNNGTINANYTANRAVSNGGGTPSFINNGTYYKSTGVTVTFNAGVPVTNSATGRFTGTGILLFSGGITNSGAIAPGTDAAPAVLRVNNPAISATSNMEVELFTSTTPGTGHDQIEISTGGVTTLNGTLTVIDNQTAPLGVYTIMSNVGGTFAGTFTTTNMPTNITNLTVNATTVTVEKIAMFPLPVVWGKFEALARNNKVQITWSTSEEINTSHFIVEHSTNGREYTALGTVQAQGNSAETHEYEFWHNTPNTGRLNYYRIHQVDLNAKSTYSIIRTVKFKDGSVLFLTASPNPFRDVLQLTVQQSDVTVVLTNTSGATIRTMQLNPGVHKINTANLSKGVYSITVYKDNEKIDAMQVVKQ